MMPPSTDVSAPNRPDRGQALVAALGGQGRRAYRLVIEEGLVVELEAIKEQETCPGGEWVTMAEAAAIFRHAKGWLSRQHNGTPVWQHLGLRPRRSGRRLLFSKQELMEHLDTQVVRRRGRPKSALAHVRDQDQSLET